MYCQEINLSVDYSKLGEASGDFYPKMTVYLPSNSPEIDSSRKRPTVVVCPGGGYGYTSDREAEPVALRFAAAGLNAVVLRYSCAPARFPVQLMELAAAVAAVRAHEQQWNVDTDKIVVCGFSAGGHLCASYGTLWNHRDMQPWFGYANGEHKPNGMILCYPVISMYAPTHDGTVENLLGDKQKDTYLRDLLSAEKQVTGDTPKAFIWHTFHDAAVPALRSLELAGEIWKQGGSAEVHVFPDGPHGLSLANETVYGDESYKPFTECQAWMDMAIRWVKNL